DGLAFQSSLVAIAALLAPIVLLLVHIVSCIYSCTSLHFVQLLFFKQALIISRGSEPMRVAKR
ncbi:hypothetical protein D7Y09_18300, partial [bacterium 1XD42-1]